MGRRTEGNRCKADQAKIYVRDLRVALDGLGRGSRVVFDGLGWGSRVGARSLSRKGLLDGTRSISRKRFLGGARNLGREGFLDGGGDVGGWQNGGGEGRGGESGLGSEIREGSIGVAGEGWSSAVEFWERRGGTVGTGGGAAEAGEGAVGTGEGAVGTGEGAVETRSGAVGTGEDAAETGEGTVLARGETSAEERHGGSGDIAAAEEGGHDNGEGFEDLREDGGKVEVASTGAVDWGETEAKGEGRLSRDTSEVHVVVVAGETVESGRDELLEEGNKWVASLIAQAKGSVDVERAGGINVATKAGSEGLDDAVEGGVVSRGHALRGYVSVLSWVKGNTVLPFGCRWRVSGSSRARSREGRTNGEQRRGHQRRGTEQRSRGS